MAGTGVGKFSSTASNNTSNLTVNFAENMAPSNVNNAARELMGHMRDMYEQLGDGYFEFGDGDGTYTIARVDADTLTIATAADLSAIYFAGRKIRVTDGGANVVEGTVTSTSHGSSLQTVNLTGITLASGAPTKVELGIDTAAFGGKVILDDDGDTYIEAPTDDTIDIYVAGAKDFVITANTFTAESGSTIAAQALTATSITSTGNIIIPNAGNIGSAGDADSIAIASDGVVTLTQKLIGTELDISGNVDVDGTTNLDVVDIDGAVDMAGTLTMGGHIDLNGNALIIDTDGDSYIVEESDDVIGIYALGKKTAEINVFGGYTHYRDGGTTFGGSTNFVHQRGTIASPAIVQSGDTIGLIKSTPYDGTAYLDGARILFQVDGTPGDDDMPTRIVFQTTADGTAGTLAESMRITSTGKIVLSGGTATSTSDLTSGGLHFHDASTSAGNIMPITFTPSATADRARAGIGFISQSSSGSAGFAADIAFYARSAADGTTLGTDDEALRINSNHEISSNGETAPDVSSGGLCLNQASQDTKILAFKSSDVAHGITDVAETDTYGVFQKLSSDGGMHIKALHDSGDQAIRMEAIAVTENSTKSTTGNSPFQIRSAKKNSAGLQVFGSNANLFHVSNNGNTKFIVDAEGELHSDGGAQTAYDTYEDAHLVRAYDLSHGNGVINSQFDKFISYNHEALAEAKLVGREEDGTPNHFVNVTGMQRLHNGAIWQQYEKTERLANAMYELAKAAVGEDKANEILEQNKIKLLN